MPAEERRPAEKAAAVISILGSERASEVFRYLTENEVEQLSMQITRLPRLALKAGQFPESAEPLIVFEDDLTPKSP